MITISRKYRRLFAFLLIFLIISLIVHRYIKKSLINDSDIPSSLFIHDHRDIESHGVLNPFLSPLPSGHNQSKSNNPFAYFSILCDDNSINEARVLAYSWRKVRSAYPLIFLAINGTVTSSSTEELIALGAEIEIINSPLKVSWRRRKNGKRLAWWKECRYNKIYLWNQTEYRKGVFLDTNLLIVNNVDELFSYGELSGVKVVGDEFNTAMFVFEPKKETFEAMIHSYLKSPPHYYGEEGFFNWFFLDRHSTVISARYNTVVRLKDYAVWPLLKKSAKIFHFARHVAPWNFYQLSLSDWELNYEPIVFYYWIQMQQQAKQVLGLDEYNPYNLWNNHKRIGDICQSLLTLYNPKKFIITNKFSVLIGTWDRLALLRRLILHYQKSKYVHKIYVTWHNPFQRLPDEFLKTVRKKPPVEILVQKYDTLNNRFNPIPNLETKAVLICDDDIRVDINDVEYAFEVWKNRPYSLVGVFPRYHVFHSQNGTYSYEIKSPDRPRQYSIMLTKFMFMHAEYLFAYTCLLPPKIHQYVDDHVNCEDIAINMMVTGMTGARPIAVLMHVDDFGTTSGISLKPGHMSSRSNCVTDLIRLFGKDTLKYNREVFIPFRRKKALLTSLPLSSPSSPLAMIMGSNSSNPIIP